MTICTLPPSPSTDPPMRTHTPIWQCGAYHLEFKQPAIMAIINLTSDSFSGDGLHGRISGALRRAEQALRDGATILDIGGESTRPGSAAVSLQDELARVIPTIRALASFNVPISVDTMKPQVMAEAIAAGASIINDINALRAPGALEVVTESNAGICLMHMQGQPRTMQYQPHYQDVVAEVEEFLAHELERFTHTNANRQRVALDPGFGFGKTLEHNLDLFRALPSLCKFDLPVLVGLSRKAMLGEITGKAVAERDVATATASVLAVQKGASILRVHNVGATRDALTVWRAIDLPSDLN